jgi:hypothetical protein
MDDDIDALYDPAAEPCDSGDDSDTMSTFSTFSAHTSGETKPVCLYGIQDVFMTWTATFEEVPDRAAPRYAVFGNVQPALRMVMCSSAVLLARRDVDAAIKRLSHCFRSMNAEYIAAHSWAQEYVQLHLPIVTDEELGLVHVVARRNLTTDQLLGHMLERCFTCFLLIDTTLDLDDQYERERELWRVLLDHITQGMPLASAYLPGHDRSDTLS